MLKIWCMFDNHTFASVDADDRLGIRTRVRKLVRQRHGASFFVRDEFDAMMNGLTWHSRDSFDGLDDWLDRLEVEISFKKLQVA